MFQLGQVMARIQRGEEGNRFPWPQAEGSAIDPNPDFVKKRNSEETPMRTVLTLACFLTAAICLSVSGCQSMRFPTAKGYTQLCQTYVGEDSSKLINAWGYPGRKFDAKNDSMVFVYVETRDEYTLNPLAHSALIEYPPRIDPRMSSPGERSENVIGQSIDSMDYCITYFEVNKDNKVTRAIWRGDCKSLEEDTGTEAHAQE